MKRHVMLSALALTLLPQSAAAGFEGYGGWWGGSGDVRVTSGSVERLRCTSTIRLTQANTELAMNLRCASTSYKIDVTTNLSTIGTVVSGTWVVNTHDIRGTVNGQMDGTNISGRIMSPDVNAAISIVRIDKRIAVTFEPSSSSAVPKITIILVRDGS